MCQTVAEFSFVPLLDRARRSPVEETRHADPSSIAATGGALSDASAALSRGFARDISEIVANVTDQKLREMTDITDKKLSEIAGKNNFTRGGDGEEVRNAHSSHIQITWARPKCENTQGSQINAC